MARNVMPFTKRDLEEIARRFPTPFHIYDEKAIRENARRLGMYGAYHHITVAGIRRAETMKDYFATLDFTRIDGFPV